MFLISATKVRFKAPTELDVYLGKSKHRIP
jgi:hypothetical protein